MLKIKTHRQVIQLSRIKLEEYCLDLCESTRNIAALFPEIGRNVWEFSEQVTHEHTTTEPLSHHQTEASKGQ